MIRRGKICNFSRIGRKTEKEQLSKGQKLKEKREGHEEQVEWEETTKGKAAPAGEAQSRRRKPGKPCEELQLQLEVGDNLQKE